MTDRKQPVEHHPDCQPCGTCGTWARPDGSTGEHSVWCKQSQPPDQPECKLCDGDGKEIQGYVESGECEGDPWYTKCGACGGTGRNPEYDKTESLWESQYTNQPNEPPQPTTDLPARKHGPSGETLPGAGSTPAGSTSPTTAEALAREAYRESQRQWCDHKPNSSVCEDCAVKPITAALDAVRREHTCCRCPVHDAEMDLCSGCVKVRVDEARQQAFREAIEAAQRGGGLTIGCSCIRHIRRLAGEES